MNRKEQEQFIFGSIFMLSNKLQLAGDSVLEEITVKQWFLLLLITKMEKNSPSITEIADFTVSTRQNTKKMLDVLEKKGFVTINQDENDRRNLSISLTPKVRQFFHQFEAAGNQFLDVLFDGISDKHLTYVQDTFQSLFINLAKIGESYEDYKR